MSAKLCETEAPCVEDARKEGACKGLGALRVKRVSQVERLGYMRGACAGGRVVRVGVGVLMLREGAEAGGYAVVFGGRVGGV